MKGVVPGVPVRREPHAEHRGLGEGLVEEGAERRLGVAAGMEYQRPVIQVDEPGMELASRT